MPQTRASTKKQLESEASGTATKKAKVEVPKFWILGTREKAIPDDEEADYMLGNYYKPLERELTTHDLVSRNEKNWVILSVNFDDSHEDMIGDFHRAIFSSHPEQRGKLVYKDSDCTPVSGDYQADCYGYRYDAGYQVVMVPCSESEVSLIKSLFGAGQNPKSWEETFGMESVNVKRYSVHPVLDQSRLVIDSRLSQQMLTEECNGIYHEANNIYHRGKEEEDDDDEGDGDDEEGDDDVKKSSHVERKYLVLQVPAYSPKTKQGEHERKDTLAPFVEEEWEPEPRYDMVPKDKRAQFDSSLGAYWFPHENAWRVLLRRSKRTKRNKNYYTWGLIHSQFLNERAYSKKFSG